MGFLKSSFHYQICTLVTKSSENFRCCFKNNFKKKFSPEKRVFFILECFSWHSEYSFNDYFKKFCHDSKKSLMNVWKKIRRVFTKQFPSIFVSGYSERFSDNPGE